MSELDQFLGRGSATTNVPSQKRKLYSTYPIQYAGSTEPDFYAFRTTVEEWVPAENAWRYLYHYEKMVYPNGVPVH